MQMMSKASMASCGKLISVTTILGDLKESLSLGELCHVTFSRCSVSVQSVDIQSVLAPHFLAASHSFA